MKINSHNLKILFRCSLAAWIASLLMFIHPTLRSIGMATFFACIVLFINPPSGIVFIFILGTLTLLFGMALAWGWGLIAMKAALAARPQEQTLARLQALQAEVTRQVNATGQDPGSIQKKLVYDGFMLDARVTVIYFVMGCVLIYFLARLRASNPKFILVQMFGTIVVDLFLTVGPLLPSFSGMLPRILVEPAAIGAGLGLVASLLVFPQSTSHTVLAAMQSLVELARRPLELTRESFVAAARNEDLPLDELLDVKTRLLAEYRALGPAMAFLPLDFSRGRWSAADVKTLRLPIRQLLLSSLLLLDFHITRVRGQANLEKLRATPTDPDLADDEVEGKGTVREIGLRQRMDSLDLAAAMTSPESETLRAGTIQVLRESSADVLTACEAAIAATTECLHAVNSRRWIGSRAPDPLEQAQTALEALRAARAAFAEHTADKLIDMHADIFDETGRLKPLNTLGGASIRGVMVGLAFEEYVLAVADALDQLLTQILSLLETRPRPRLWFPTGLHDAISWVLRRNASTPVPGTGAGPDTDPDDDTSTQSDEAQQLFRRISRGYRVKPRRGLARIILGTYRWLTNAEGLFALRMVVVSIALAVPAVIPSSAGFYFRAKGVWGLIMAQTTLLIYMADFTFSVLSRAVGTVVGGVVGLAAWYIGSGRGSGNPYGMAAITAPVVVIFMAGRIFLSRALLQATIMSAATYFLIVGYSYDDAIIPQYGNPGIGYHVFWRRLVLVFVGLAAASIVQIFPRPPSAARHICHTLSHSLSRLTDHYALFLSCWSRSSTPGSGSGVGSASGLASTLAAPLSIELSDRLSSLDDPIALLAFEFSSSRFDAPALRTMQSLSHDLNRNLGRLLYLSATLSVDLQTRMDRVLGILDPKAISDLMAVLALLAQALKTGDPLPEVLPAPLLKRCYERWCAVPAELGTELIREKEYRRFCVGVMAYLKVLASVDEMVMVVKGVLGEGHVVQRVEV